MPTRHISLAIIAAVFAPWGTCAHAAEPDEADYVDYRELAMYSLEELMATQVTSVAGVGQDYFETPAAMYVITGEEARRSGHRMLADVLRLAPGVFVGTVNSHSRTVGTRGFNGGLANKTLVLIDGRAVYDPLFSGTFWDVQDILLEDLDRIEVIRGPGATLWGANAVNGVINVTTKSAKDTQGLYLSAGAGTEERGFGEARYGGQIGDSAWFRVWGKWADHDNLTMGGDVNPHDEWDLGVGGFRFDAEDGEGGALMIDFAAYDTDRKGESIRIPVPGAFFSFDTREGEQRAGGGHLLAKLSKEYDDSGWSLQAYYDQTTRVQRAGFQADRQTADIEFRHHFRPFDRHELLWGVGYRYTADQTDPSVELDHDPRDQERNTLSAFVQDTVTIVPEKLFFMAGSKFEINDVTGFEIQPSGRLWWTPNDRHTLWGAVSRSVRVPSRFEEEGILTFAYFDPILPPFQVVGNDDLDAEEVLTYELGHRVKLTRGLTLDTTLFYNEYANLIGVGPGVVSPPPPFTHRFNNDGSGETYGGELTLTWQAADNLRVVGGYSYVDVQIHGPVFSADEENTPHHMAQLRGYLDVTKDLGLNAALYYVDTVPAVDADPYLRLDVGVTWRVNDQFEVAAWGQNLLDPEHREFTGIEAERGFYVMGTFRY